MLVVVSPAKKLDMSAVDAPAPSAPQFADEASALATVAQGLSEADLQKLMKISAPLAKLNAERFANFGHQERKQAALAFAGDTYQGLEAATLDADEMAWAQERLRILSGLYGLLRPLDAMEPYRLEMGSRLQTERGKSLYDWWGDRISKALNAQAESVGASTLINCASQEYFGAVDLNALKLDVITPVFMEERAGTPKIIGFYAKKARGAMARFVIQNRLTNPESLKDFSTGGYAFDAKASAGDKMVFIRPEAAQKDAA